MEQFARAKALVSRLYTGNTVGAARFRYGLILFDSLTIAFFVVTTPMGPSPSIFAVDVLLGVVICADFLARFWIAPNKPRMLRQLYTMADLIVIFSLLLAPFFTANFAFLRVLRSLRLLHSYHVLRDLRRNTPFFRRNEDVIFSAINLAVFIFVMSSLVLALQYRPNTDIDGFVDALYFTVSTLTTTGFGDITLTGTTGRLLSVFIMVVGVALFLRLAQAIFRPAKVNFTCPDCGLTRHDPDAVHCKHCGRTIKIETEGGD